MIPSTHAIVTAIWLIEGGEGTRFPYGIKDHHHHTQEQARRICWNTVENAKRDYFLYRPKEEFLEYLSDRYVPIEDDPVGHRNWVRFMRKRFYGIAKKHG